jgi:hypothetical protein
MIYAFLALTFFAGCSLRSTYPTLGAIAGGGAGSLAGPGGAALGAGIGAVGGEALKNADALVEAEETIQALSHGDVSALVAQGMAEHQSGFAEFTSYIKRILIGAAVALGCYLLIPIFVARRCSKTEAEKHLTRAPFPRPSDPK